MKVVETLEDLRSAEKKLQSPLGLVPTMGYLHAGHLALVRQARQECQSVVVSIYVNPSQFGPTEDLQKYPRDLAHDLDLLRAAGVDLVWTPTNEVMYPLGYQTWVTVDEVTKHLEGAIRPGHFRGVATVVSKLFNAIQPAKAYFGQKDAQQALVIRRMALDLNFPVEIVVCPIIREPDGLALSSRNVYLNPAERQAAIVLSRSLSKARAAYEAGERNADHLRLLVTTSLAAEPLVKVQYVSCAHPDTLVELEGPVEHALISLAVTVGKTRLIDNVLL